MNNFMAGADIRARREALGWSQEQLGERVGTKQQTIQRIETGETKFSRYLTAIDEALSEAEKRINKEFTRLPTATQLPLETLASETPAVPRGQLKIFAAAQGGGGIVIVSTDPVEYRPLPHYLANALDAYGVFVVGESMAPRYEPGEVAEVAPHKPLRRDTDVILYGPDRQGDRRAMIKRLVGWTETEWHLRQFNPPRDFTVSKSDWPIAHAIIGRGPA